MGYRRGDDPTATAMAPASQWGARRDGDGAGKRRMSMSCLHTADTSAWPAPPRCQRQYGMKRREPRILLSKRPARGHRAALSLWCLMAPAGVSYRYDYRLLLFFSHSLWTLLLGLHYGYFMLLIHVLFSAKDAHSFISIINSASFSL